jgi:hypothetical protein
VRFIALAEILGGRFALPRDAAMTNFVQRTGVEHHFDAIHYGAVLNWCLTPTLEDDTIILQLGHIGPHFLQLIQSRFLMRPRSTFEFRLTNCNLEQSQRLSLVADAATAHQNPH